ncbi:MAG: PAS domain S-box protein [Ignavibacteria bacterium]|nr:PAS domain S-box protein [Ignavibacteria bacterium]
MTSIRIKINSYKNAVKNKQVVEIIDKIISSYPVSFVNLERLRKEIDLLNELFWIKDEEGKYLLVNNKFALSFHLTPSQIEGKPVDKFIPAYLIDFNKALDDYIKESRSVFIIEGFPLSGVAAGEDYQAIEIPVPNVEGNLSAIIGIAQKAVSLEEKPENFSSALNLFKDFIRNFILISNENIIKDLSEEFCNIFTLDAEKIKGKNYNNDISGLPVLISSSIDNFIKSGKDSQTKDITIPGMPDKYFKLYFIKGKEEEKLILIEIINFVEASQIAADNDHKSYDLIIQNNPEPVFIYDKENLKFLQVNDAALKLYGYRKDEFLLLDLTDLYTPEDIQTLLEASEEKSKEGVFSKPSRQKRKDGANIFVEINRTRINYKNKQAYLIMVKNVTERLNLEKESQHFKAAFNNTDNLMFITDKEGFIKSVNNPVTEVLGYSNKSFMETSLTSLLINEDRGKINSSVFQSDSKEKLTFDTSLKKAGNEFLKVRLTANPIFNYNGEVESYNIVCSVVQEKVKEIIKEVIKEVPVEVSHEEKLISESIPEINFLSGIFHDLLTPINVILGFAQELTENIEQPSPEQKEAVEIINQNRENLLNTLNHIIEFIQTEKGKIELNLESVKIIDIIEDLKQQIDEKNILGDGELAFGKISSSLEVVADKQKIQKLFVLLIKLISKITSIKKVYISASQLDEKYFSISLRDNYNTSSEKFLEKMSLVFSGDYKMLKEPGFTLFSFKLCKNLLNLLNGKFKISEERDKKDGLFVFPIKFEKEIVEEEMKEGGEIKSSEVLKEKVIIHEMEETEKEESIKNVHEVIQQETSINLPHLSCLYIEDQLDSQMFFSMQMNDLKDINFAVSLEQAVPLLNSKNFDFIVVDINLQGDYNGLDILKIIRTMPDYENVPVIAVTAYLLPVNRELYIQAGFSDFISKPILRENLLNSLERTLIPLT